MYGIKDGKAAGSGQEEREAIVVDAHFCSCMTLRGGTPSESSSEAGGKMLRRCDLTTGSFLISSSGCVSFER